MATATTPTEIDSASRFPRAWRFLLIVIPALLLLQTGLRVLFYRMFRETTLPLAPGELIDALALGVRFDLRLTLVLLAPMLLASLVSALNPERSAWARRFWCGHLTFVTSLVLVVFIFDLGHYGYLGRRLEASSLQFLRNPLISAQMVLESYPVFWGALAMLLFAAGAYVVYRVAMKHSYAVEVPRPTALGSLAVSVITVALFCAGIYGKLSWYPLRWSDAYASTHRLAADVAMNPVLFFVGSLGVAEAESYDEDAVRAAYPRVAAYLGVETPDVQTLSFARAVRPVRPAGFDGTRPNIVIVLLESFAAHKTGTFGNPLDASPRFDALAADALLYTNFYTPRRGTARGVFATMTGIPDTMTVRTASRNPQAVRQRIMANGFEGYERFYFLGGSANWANIRGLLAHNIEDLQIFEEGSFDADRADVWGISDLHLFEEANRVFAATERPFFALIHCSGNHRPYTIPDDHRGFILREVDETALVENGFESIDEFNSFRFLDHAIGFFIDIAREKPYFENTAFFFFADNGTGGRAPHMAVGAARHDLLEHHSPLAIYAPGCITEGRRIARPASQIDVMATAAALVGDPVTNTTMGRNLFDDRFDSARYALIQPTRGATPEVGLLDEDLLMLVRADGSNPRLFAYRSETPGENLAETHATQLAEMTELGLGLYNVSKWMLYHNGPKADGDGGAP